jgi:hypothetical protein
MTALPPTVTLCKTTTAASMCVCVCVCMYVHVYLCMYMFIFIFPLGCPLPRTKSWSSYVRCVCTADCKIIGTGPMVFNGFLYQFTIRKIVENRCSVHTYFANPSMCVCVCVCMYMHIWMYMSMYMLLCVCVCVSEFPRIMMIICTIGIHTYIHTYT